MRPPAHHHHLALIVTTIAVGAGCLPGVVLDERALSGGAAAPVSAFTATDAEVGGRLNLAWTLPDDPAPDSVRVLRRNDGFPTSLVDDLAVTVFDGVGTGVSDTGELVDGEAVNYAAFALYDGGARTSPPATVSGTPSDKLAPPPLADVAATLEDTGAGGVFVQLGWNTTTEQVRVFAVAKTGSAPTAADDGDVLEWDGGAPEILDGPFALGVHRFYLAFVEDFATPPNRAAGVSADVLVEDAVPPALNETFVAFALDDERAHLFWSGPAPGTAVGDEEAVRVARRVGAPPVDFDDAQATVLPDLPLTDGEAVDAGLPPASTVHYLLAIVDDVGLVGPVSRASVRTADGPPPAVADSVDGNATGGWSYEIAGLAAAGGDDVYFSFHADFSVNQAPQLPGFTPSLSLPGDPGVGGIRQALWARARPDGVVSWSRRNVGPAAMRTTGVTATSAGLAVTMVGAPTDGPTRGTVLGDGEATEESISVPGSASPDLALAAFYDADDGSFLGALRWFDNVSLQGPSLVVAGTIDAVVVAWCKPDGGDNPGLSWRGTTAVVPPLVDARCRVAVLDPAGPDLALRTEVEIRQPQGSRPSLVLAADDGGDVIAIAVAFDNEAPVTVERVGTVLAGPTTASTVIVRTDDNLAGATLTPLDVRFRPTGIALTGDGNLAVMGGLMLLQAIELIPGEPLALLPERRGLSAGIVRLDDAGAVRSTTLFGGLVVGGVNVFAATSSATGHTLATSGVDLLATFSSGDRIVVGGASPILVGGAGSYVARIAPDGRARWVAPASATRAVALGSGDVAVVAGGGDVSLARLADTLP